MSERVLIASMMRDRSAFDKIAKHLDGNDLTEQAKVIIEHIGEYYGRDPQAMQVQPDLLVRSITRSLSNPKHHPLFQELVTGIVALEASPANVVEDYIAVKRDAVGAKLATLLASNKGQKEILPVLEQYREWASKEDLGTRDAIIYNQVPVLSIVSKRNQPGEIIRVLPRALNERLDGGLLRGHHVIVFARPEVGKTTFLVNAVRGFLQQGLRVLYCGNEDPMDDIVMRCVGCLSDMTKYEILENPEKAQDLALSAGYDKLVLAALSPGSPQEIERLAQDYKPDVILVDQLRNLGVGKEENFTRKLEVAAAGMRNVGQRQRALVISVTQAGDSASGKSVLDMGDVDSSNTGIPAQADVLIGIGMSNEDERFGRRVLSLPKNKAGGNHSPVPISVDFTKFRIRSE